MGGKEKEGEGGRGKVEGGIRFSSSKCWCGERLKWPFIESIKVRVIGIKIRVI